MFELMWNLQEHRCCLKQNDIMSRFSIQESYFSFWILNFWNSENCLSSSHPLLQWSTELLQEIGVQQINIEFRVLREKWFIGNLPFWSSEVVKGGLWEINIMENSKARIWLRLSCPVQTEGHHFWRTRVSCPHWKAIVYFFITCLAQCCWREDWKGIKMIRYSHSFTYQEEPIFDCPSLQTVVLEDFPNV